ncbi:MAG: FAD-dependent oxidoreductase [Candidatus Hydrogenedentes bacterium]|nr:FAD-dependent oxidoreductase [Candidatus Hydrogenedentota bacterium]
MHLHLNPAPYAAVDPPVRDGAYRTVSFWHETVPITPGPPLDHDVDCDVAIIGGGYTGLSTAYHLKQYAPDLSVVLLERAVIGHGASGRNGGFAMPLLGWDLLYTAEKLGEAAAGRAYRLMYDAVEHVKRMVREHQLDCDLETTGYIMINTCKRREARARREHTVAERLGFDHQWLDHNALQEHIRGEQFLSGIYDPHPCILNPAKLARAMKRLIESLGVQVYEQTPLTELVVNRSPGARLTLRTPQAKVQARQVVLAVNGYGASLGFMKDRILPVHTYIVLTEPLSQQQLEGIGWAKYRTSLETARNMIHYFRLTADRRIAFGGEDADLYPGGAYKDVDEKICAALKARFREYFPSLRDVRFTHQWGGVLGVSLDMFPSFGRGGPDNNVFHATGYSGHGVSLSNYAGALLAPEMLHALGVPNPPPRLELPFFYGKQPSWLPPGPLRYYGMRAYRLALRAQDRLEGA